MLIAAAQTKPVRFNVEKNLENHYRKVETAAEMGVKLITFPELSITGYERAKAAEFAFTPTDSRLDGLKEMAKDKNIIIVAGAPVLIHKEMFIGSFIIQPDNSVALYTKQFLHTGEEVSFSSSFDYNPHLELDGERITFAICADIDHAQHPQNASKFETSLYLPSIFFSPKGIPGAYENLSNYAKTYKMNILMSNYCGESYGSASGGSSAFWNNSGKLVGNLNSSDEGLLLAERVDGNWRTVCRYL